MKKVPIILIAILFCLSIQIYAQIPTNVLVQIVKAEDELRFDKTLEDLMKSTDAKIRKRAVLAAGRIGDDRAIASLTNLLEKDADTGVREMAAFSLGEIESLKSVDAILKVLQDTKNADEIRARAIEAAGKIAAANATDEKSKDLGKAILDNLEFELQRSKQQNRELVLFGITAVLRAKPQENEVVVAKFLTNPDARVRADAANTLARHRAKNANAQFRTMLASDKEPIARANAARGLGASEDKEAFDLLIKATISDEDSRVRVSAIRAVGSLKVARAADRLLERGEKLLADYKKSKFANPSEKSELLEITTTLGRILSKTNDEKAVNFVEKFRGSDKFNSPETEIAFAQIAPDKYLKEFNAKNNGLNDWRVASSYAQGLGEIAKQTNEDLKMRGSQTIATYFNEIVEKVTAVSQSEMNKAVPDLIRAITEYKSEYLPYLLREIITTKDVFARASSAESLAETAATEENIEALNRAFDYAIKEDKKYNDAQLAILDALFKLDKLKAIPALAIGLDAPDVLVRRKAVALLKQIPADDIYVGARVRLKEIEEKGNNVKPYKPDYGTKLGMILNSNADYLRAVLRKNGQVKAVLTTEKGNFTIDFLPEDAPLTVDNFIKLAKSGYFNGLPIHRVVANFVMQDGDPRGDGNGGPGWEIRDEMNTVPYERGAVGMALSGKDTGGSQWFVTHSPQPHLDGGYTVFGRISEADMKIVDNLVRGDKILKVQIVETVSRKTGKKIAAKNSF